MKSFVVDIKNRYSQAHSLVKEIVDWSCGDRSLVDYSLAKEILSGHSVVTWSLLSGRLIL